MCTLIALHRCIAGAPLVVAANRDEFHDRPTEGPALRETWIEGPEPPREGGCDGAGRSRRVVSPLDLRAGGTWLGVNSDGLFAAVTNRRTERPDPERRSRGWLVMEALGAANAREAAERLEFLPESAYNPFNLFVADAETAHLVSYGERPERFELAPGVHVIGNLHPEEASAKLERLRRELAQLDASESGLEGLAELCRTHVAEGALDSTCVHAGPYGTRSSTLLRLGEDPALHYADGPPCEAPYRDLTPLLRALELVPLQEGVQA